MKCFPEGHEGPWLAENKNERMPIQVALLNGEVALIAIFLDVDLQVKERRTLLCFKGPTVLPAITGTPRNVQIRMKVVCSANVSILSPDDKSYQEAVSLDWASLIDGQPGLGPSILRASLEDTAQAIDPCLESLIQLLCRRNGGSFYAGTITSTSPYDQIIQMLSNSSLVYRTLRMKADDLAGDCGDLLIFLESKPILLLSEDNGYRVFRHPFSRSRSYLLSRREMLNWPNTLSAIEVLPSLPSDTHIAHRLLYFTYGEAKKQGSIFLLVTVVGLVLGFIFSIGRQVGAARWIAGMGIMGALLGGSLALLSNSLRLPLIAAFLSALVGLLVPTINTLLTNTALPEKDLSLMLQLGALFLAAAISDIGLRWTEARTLLTAQEKGEHRLELAALQHLLRLPMSFFNSFRVGDLSLRFAAIAGAQNEIRSLISSGALQSILSVIYLLFMLRISPRLTLLTTVLALLLVVPIVAIGRKCLQLERRREELFADSNNRNIELIGSVTKLRMAGAEREAQTYWWSSFANSIRFQYEVDKRLAMVSILPIVMPSLGLLLLFIVISGIATEAATNPSLKTPNIGQLLGFLSAFSTFIAAISSVGLLIVQAFELPVLIDRAKPILECQEESLGDSIDPGIINGKIDFLNVSFRYRDSGPWTLDCINLSIKAGEFVAIVGPTGSGKTTITRLLLRLESPQQGNILLDDKPLEKIRIDALRQQMGVVTQNSSLLAGSIFDVIAGGRLIDIETAWFAAEAASLGDDIRALPMGINTFIPEGGAWLSGGQRQRLAIARSLSRKPRLLVLDEATSSLDNITQLRVSTNLQELEITMLVVAHRLSTVRHADRILVLENGRIVQDGSFDNLSSTDGPFLALMQNQIEEGLDSGPNYS